MSENAFVRFSGEVSEGKASIGFGVVLRSVEARELRFVGLRASRATAKLP